MLGAAHPMPAQQQTASQFISGVESAITSLTANLAAANPPMILGGQVVFAHGSSAASWTATQLLEYVDGLKAAGVQRAEFNPGVTTINNPAAVANLDAMVRHIRQLGMLLAINPEYTNSGGVGEFPVNTFQDFQNMAMQTYPMLAARYQPDNFVIVHEPTTMAARMGITTTPAQWAAFVEAVEPLIKAASPRTQVGAGDCAHCNETSFFAAFAAIPTCDATTTASGCLDVMTVDLYSDSVTDLAQVAAWAQTAQAFNKGIYMEETFAPHYLPSPLPPGCGQSSPSGLEGCSTIGAANAMFETMEEDWLSGMALYDASLGMQAMTAFTTQTFFLYVTSPGDDKATDSAYLLNMAAAMQQGQLTGMAASYAQDVATYGIKTVTSISNASYATLPTIFIPNCGTPGNPPCNPNSTAAPDMLMSAFGVDLANQKASQSDFPTKLGGTTATLVDSANQSYAVPLYSVSPSQVNYLVPSGAAPGPATLTITSGDGTVTTGIIFVAPVSPGLYTFSANGQGTAAAIAVCYGTCKGWTNSLGGSQYWQYTSAPLSWGAGDLVAIELFGTGIRHRAAQSDITAAAGGTRLPVTYAEAQGSDTGLDQVNVDIPQSLNGAGEVSLSLSVQYTDPVTKVNYTSSSNAVNLCLQGSACK